MPKTTEELYAEKMMREISHLGASVFDREVFLKQLLHEHGTIQQDAARVAIAILNTLADVAPQYTDMRNECAVKYAQQVRDLARSGVLNDGMPRV